MRSLRLPGKVLQPVGGVPLLRRLYVRLGASRRADAVIVATSVEPDDTAIERDCRRWEIPVYRGAMTDLIERLSGAAGEYGLTAIVRATADNPLTDPEGIDALIDTYLATRADLVHNKHRRGYPYGTGAEIVSTDALRRCDALATQPEDREDFIGWMARQRDGFRCLTVDAPETLIRPYFLTVDYPEDLRLFTHIYGQMASDDAPLAAVVKYLDEHPEIANINRHLHTTFPR